MILKWYNIYKEYSKYLYCKLLFHIITKNRYSYKFIRGYIVKIVRQIHFVHSRECCHSLIQKNEIWFCLIKTFLCIIFYSILPHLEFILALMYIWIGEIYWYFYVYKDVCWSKKIGQSIYSLFYLLQYFCMFAWKMLCSMIKDMSVTSTHHLSRFLFILYTKIVKRPFKIHFE